MSRSFLICVKNAKTKFQHPKSRILINFQILKFELRISYSENPDFRISVNPDFPPPITVVLSIVLVVSHNTEIP